MRPGCDRPAAARLAYDPVACQLWLDPLDRLSAPVQEVCEFHVERLTVPRGWSVLDRRPGHERDATTPAEPVPDRPPAPSRSPESPRPPRARPAGRRPVRDDADQLDLLADLDASAPAPPASAPATVPAPAAASAPAPVPAREPVREPAAVTPAEPGGAPARPPSRRSGLLARAFDSAGPQHSVLTQTKAADGAGDGDEPAVPGDA